MAGGTLHEDLRREDQAAAPSERKFGLTLGGILALIAIVKLIERSPWGLLWGALATRADRRRAVAAASISPCPTGSG